jgi:hypothetical protein
MLRHAAGSIPAGSARWASQMSWVSCSAFSRLMACRQWDRASSVQSSSAGELGRKILIR